MDVRLTNKENTDGTNGAPALYANIPIVSIKDENKNAIKAEKQQESNNIETQETEEQNNNQENNDNQEGKQENQ